MLNFVKSSFFFRYCEKALKNYDFKAPKCEIFSSETQENLDQWKRVVVFYTLRLMLAPCVENVVLYDRLLFLMENGCDVDIFAAFDATISPRCHVTSAIKNVL